MEDFNTHLQQVGEIGYIEEVVHSIVYASGLPQAMPHEVIIFESGDFGQVLSLGKNRVEILVFSKNPVQVGMKVVRTNRFLEVPVGNELLGQIIDPLGYSLDHLSPFKKPKEYREIDSAPGGIETRKRIAKPCHTGYSLIDLIIPLGKGQRELVIGDRKTGKTNFLFQTILSQSLEGTICIYAAIGKRKSDIKKAENFFTSHGIMQNVILVASSSHDPSSVIYLTPYTAMTIAEYFRDNGKDVLVVLDDLSTHAKFYREIALLGRRFPGRNSYPGDIFYTHAKLLERAGNFITKNGENSITCIPVVESSQGDMSGYIQTNIMSMTDGHIYFDSDLFTEGRRPAINPFLSVTRVGRQTQTNIKREINRELNSFLTLFQKLQSFIHFGAELSDSARLTLSTGEKILSFFDQTTYGMLSPTLQMFLFCMLWAGVWQETMADAMKKEMETIILSYKSNERVKSFIDKTVESSTSFNNLLDVLKKDMNELRRKVGISNA